MRALIQLDREDIQREIPYALIATVRFSHLWDTKKRKDLWLEMFDEKERKAAHVMFNKARLWYLVKGAPDEETMSLKTLKLWQKLGEFCSIV